MSSVALVFGFNRPDHLRKTLDALDSANYFTHLPIFINIDGPRCEADINLVASCIDIAYTFKKNSLSTSNVQVCHRSFNKGLARSITDTITNQLSYYESALIIEDDIVLDPLSIIYFQKQISLHKDNPAIQSVALFNPSNDLVGVPFLSPRMMCWGWGTWRHKWNNFLPKSKGKSIFNKYPSLKDYYSNFVGLDSYSTLQKCLFDGKDVWACRWILSHIYSQSFCLIPPRSLSTNIGLDGSGQNCGSSSTGSTSSLSTCITLKNIEHWTRSKPLLSVHLMQLFAAQYDKNVLNIALDRNLIPLFLNK